MATIPGLAQGLRLTACAAVLLGAGCVATDIHKVEAPPKPGTACQVVVTWQNSVMFTPDPAQGGNPAPGFAARVYLFGQEIDFPLLAEGELVFDLIDETAGPPRWLERWTFDSENVHRLAKKDMIGWGYTVFLPSKEVRPDMSKIRMRTAFRGPKGAPIYSENVVTLSPMNGVIRKGTAPFQLPGSKGMQGHASRAENAGPTLPAPTPAR